MVIWIIGLSASGKTTLGKIICEILSRYHSNVVFLDGDMIRGIMGHDLGHSLQDRKKNAWRISKLCRALAKQNIHVVCAILSLFHESQKWNRENIADYKEIFLDVSFENLLKRETKGIYRQALNKELTDVVGVDIPFDPPYAPDLVIDNNPENPNFYCLAQKALQDLGIDIRDGYRYSCQNRLEKPEKYQYTEYQGQLFLENFQVNRKNAITDLSQKIQKYQDLYGDKTFDHPWVEKFNLAKESSIFFVKELPIPREIELKQQLPTTPFLISELHTMLVERRVANQQIILKLMQRFEVTKKLYQSYTLPQLKRQNRDYKNAINYSLFALLLEEMYSLVTLEQKFAILNSVLKLNDLSISIKETFFTPIASYLLWLSLVKEQEIYQQLYQEKIL